MPLQKNNFKMFYALSLAWQLGFLIAVPIAGFFFLGFLADKFLGTRPLFLILGLLLGIITTVYEVYHWILPLIRPVKDENSKISDQSRRDSIFHRAKNEKNA